MGCVAEHFQKGVGWGKEPLVYKATLNKKNGSGVWLQMWVRAVKELRVVSPTRQNHEGVVG